MNQNISVIKELVVDYYALLMMLRKRTSFQRIDSEHTHVEPNSTQHIRTICVCV